MDKRAHDRTKLWFPVTVVSNDRSIWAVCYDASAGGMRLSCSQTVVPSSTVTLVFRIVPDDPVIWSARGRDASHARSTMR